MIKVGFSCLKLTRNSLSGSNAERGSKVSAGDISRQSWRLVCAQVPTVPGASVMVTAAASALRYRAPYALLPHLAAACASPAAKMGLVAAGVALPVVAQPLFSVLEAYTTEVFCDRFMKKEQSRLATLLAQKAQQQKPEYLDTPNHPGLLSDNYELSQEVAGALSQAVKLGVNIALSVSTLALLGSASPVMIGVTICLAVFPIVVNVVSRRLKLAASAQSMSAQKSLEAYCAKCPDEALIGPKSVKKSWAKGCSDRLKTVRQAHLKEATVANVSNLIASLPGSTIQAATQIPWQSRKLFHEEMNLLSDEWLQCYSTVSSAIGSLGAALDLATGLTSIGRKLEAQERLFEEHCAALA